MTRSEFKERLKQYKAARELNPLLKYWEWKAVPKYDEGTNEVTGPPTYEDWYKDITRPTLNTFDDVHLKVGMEEAVTDLHNIAMTLPGYASKWGEYQKSKPKKDPSIKLFVNDLWENENPNNVGYRNGRYYPHGSPEGGTMTIGPGFKLGSGSHDISDAEAYSGMTKNRLNQEAIRVGKKHLNAVDLFLNYGQNTNPADTVSPLIKMGLMDLRHQVGPLNEWHNLRKAVLTGDLDKIKKESIVTWDDDGEIKVDTRRKKIRDAKYFHYSEGGEVELTPIDPVEMLARTRYQINGIPINDQPLSGTDPIGEAMMWGIGGGAAAALSRKLFPTYGAMLGTVAFGDNGKDEMLVIPNNPNKANTPIAKSLVNREVKDYYATDVIPRDVVYPDNTSFISDENFMYDILPNEHFNPGVAGYYDKLNNQIAINDLYATNKVLLDDVVAHEVDHLYNSQYPLDKQRARTLNNAYTVLEDNVTRAANAARKTSEKRATNKNIRHSLYVELKDKLGHTPSIEEMNEFIDSIPDLELFDRLRRANSYGAAYALSIKDRADLLNTPVNQYEKARATKLRKALKQIAMTESDQNSNYA